MPIADLPRHGQMKPTTDGEIYAYGKNEQAWTIVNVGRI